MTAAQRNVLPSAVRWMLDTIDVHGMLPGSMTIAEHADGSGRWHIIAECYSTDGGDDRTLRVLLDERGGMGEVETIGDLR